LPLSLQDIVSQPYGHAIKAVVKKLVRRVLGFGNLRSVGLTGRTQAVEIRPSTQRRRLQVLVDLLRPGLTV
jgi:hypothetical protein